MLRAPTLRQSHIALSPGTPILTGNSSTQNLGQIQNHKTIGSQRGLDANSF